MVKGKRGGGGRGAGRHKKDRVIKKVKVPRFAHQKLKQLLKDRKEKSTLVDLASLLVYECVDPIPPGIRYPPGECVIAITEEAYADLSEIGGKRSHTLAWIIESA